MKYCVAAGNPFEGLTLHGPFDTWEEANEFAASTDGDWWIVDLHDPKEDN